MMREQQGNPDAVNAADLPTATVRARRRVSLAWILPLLALVLLSFLVWRSWSMRGEHITVTFEQGYGIRIGDQVRYRGIVVGEVEDIALSESMDETMVTLALRSQSDQIARQGTLFWIVRPLVGPAGVSGLDTIVGPRYIAVRPGNPAAPRRDAFIGLDDAPVVEAIREGDLEITLESAQRGSLQAGGPVLFREFRVGTVLSVNLASDGSAVEARLHIEKPYAGLVTTRTRFWDSGGVELDVGLTGITMEVDSLVGVVIGSVSFATPPGDAATVQTGHRFRMAAEADPEWLEWEPTLAVGDELLPAGARLPDMERAQLTWETSILRRDKSRSGWVLVVEGGVLGPANLLRPEPDSADASSRLAIAGGRIVLNQGVNWEANGLRSVNVEAIEGRAWPPRLMRSPSEPEDCLILTSGTAESIPLAAVRLSQGEGFWRVDEALSFDSQWHGACVLSRSDGMLVGLLLVEDGVGRVALLPQGVGE